MYLKHLLSGGAVTQPSELSQLMLMRTQLLYHPGLKAGVGRGPGLLADLERAALVEL